MTERDFEIVEGWLREAMEYGEERHNEPYEKAIKALEEIPRYRDLGTVDELAEMQVQYYHLLHQVKEFEKIGTIEEFKALKEKNVAKKIAHQGCYDKEGVLHIWNGINGVPYDLCPNCEINLCTDGRFGRDKSKIKYCNNCGQKLDFGKEG